MSYGDYTKGDKGIYLSGKRAGAKEERERIIKLLEGAEREANTAKPITGGSYGYWEGLNKAIALIKGENSE